ncbi:MAG: 23S rRNA (adenine(2503)-C(2))-methyltransferase RlmN [Flavobacteriales bacterium]|nr:MAG: 23S rRNA (adenine(2503)-C(2))-methyltransferase RlmN [Flavobacteriales bacterium]
MSGKQNIRILSKEELTSFFVEQNEKAFRAKQVYEWIWKKGVTSFDEMTNLSFDVREMLSQNFIFNAVVIAEKQVSKDRTIKNAFRLYDGKITEGVLIPGKKRMTACISSQVGCSLSCSFCATGKLERLRNIDAEEIFDQVILIKNQAEEDYQRPLSNIVYMGMGEPLLNYKNVLRSIEMITSPEGLGMSPKRITVSTAGIAKMIMQLGDDEVKFNLALSLHAATDAKRSEIMPINESNSLEALSEALIYFHEKTGSRVTFEYIIFKDFNDTLEDAKDLAAFCKAVPCKINIIEYNSIDDAQFEKADSEKTDKFAAFLENTFNLIVNVRRSRGKDIDAACGQLANKNKVAN